MNARTLRRKVTAVADNDIHGHALVDEGDGLFVGYIVFDSGAFYLVSDDLVVIEELPSFVRSKSDAVAYFRLAAEWKRKGADETRVAMDGGTTPRSC